MDSILGLIVIVFVFVVGIIDKNSKQKKKNASTKPERPMPTKSAELKRQASAAVKAGSAKALKALTEEARAVRAESTPAQPTVRVNVPQKNAPAEKPPEKLSLIEAFMKGNSLEGQSHDSMSMGESVTDENGCIGGSIGEHTEEGESLAEHAEHIAVRDAALAAEHSIAQDAAALRRANRQELRRAIVLAEILDKPVALRRRT